MLPDANLRYQEALDWRKRRMQLPSFVRAVLIELSLVRSATRDAGGPGSNPTLGKQWSRDYPIDIPATPTLPYANLRYQEALDWRKWTKGRPFVRAVLVELS